MGGRDSAKMEGLESSNLGFAWGRRVRSYVHKTGATSRRSGSTSQCSRGFICQCHNVETNVVTFKKGEIATSRRGDPTSRRSREWCQLTSRHWG